MAAQKGREFLAKVETTPGGGTFASIGGQTGGSISITVDSVDVTTKEDAGIRTLLEGAGKLSISAEVSGTAKDDANLEIVRAAAHSVNNQINFQLVVPGASNGGTYEGQFAISNFSFSANDNEAVTYSFTLESSGAITFS